MSSQFEYERRFLVKDPSIVTGCSWELITQGYALSTDTATLMVRLRDLAPTSDQINFDVAVAQVIVKGPRIGAQRRESVSELEDPALAMLALHACPLFVTKRRYHLVENDLAWDVDLFVESNQNGLMIAEVEMENSVLLAAVSPPKWSGVEVTRDRRYNNENLAVSRTLGDHTHRGDGT